MIDRNATRRFRVPERLAHEPDDALLFGRDVRVRPSRDDLTTRRVAHQPDVGPAALRDLGHRPAAEDATVDVALFENRDPLVARVALDALVEIAHRPRLALQRLRERALGGQEGAGDP